MEPSDRFPCRPRVVRARLCIKWYSLHDTILDLSENSKQQLSGDPFRSSQKAIEGFLRADLKELLSAEVARVHLLVHKEDRDACGLFLIRKHPEARHHSSIERKGAAMDVEAAARWQVDQWLLEKLWATDGDDEIRVEFRQVLKKRRIVHVSDVLTVNTVTLAHAVDRVPPELRGKYPGA